MNSHPPELSSTVEPPARGWRANLALQFQRSGNGTRLTRRVHSGPLLVQRAFYPEGPEPCHVYIIHPPGGVASGDDLALDVELTAGSHAVLTTPAAGKFYRRGAAGVSRVTQALRVEGALLEWLPQENIFYPNAAVDLRTIVKLSSTARFIGWEIGCLGLPASGRTLEGGDLRFNFELWQDDRPVLLERLALAGASLSARWGLAGYASLGTAMFYPATLESLTLARASVPANCAESVFACTLVDRVLVCRALAQRADHLRQAFVRLWQVLRPELLGREAVLPRIWNT